ncbi:HD domain-containing protein [Paraburkholderia fungorum]|uniref:HD domain-containing protein n=1 Tax=Paraburkholderia fungorum TaxID=134537 RepID=UPI0038B79A0E
MSNTIIRAIDFAAKKHCNQRRKDAERTPYINHPLAVANLLANEAGIDDEYVLVAAILHDTIEDTSTTDEELTELFGSDVAAIVQEVSDDKSLTKDERKRLQITYARSLSYGAKLVKIADMISNLRDIAANPPADWSVERKTQYFEWARAVVDAFGDVNPTLETLFGEAYDEGIAAVLA